MSHIDEGLALSLAGQVSAGLTPGEGQHDRMYGSLVAIGLMVRNASRSEAVQETLDLIDRSEVTEHGDGVTRYETHFAWPEDADPAS
jgi:hypothetical protein